MEWQKGVQKNKGFQKNRRKKSVNSKIMWDP